MDADLATPARFGWHWIWRTIALRRRQVLLLLAIVAILYALSLVFPIALQRGIDVIGAKGSGPLLLGLVGLAILSTLAEARLTGARQTIVIDLATFIDRRVARLAFAHLMRVRIDAADFRAGETLNRFGQARKLQSFVLNDLPVAVFETGSFLIAIVAVFFYDRLVGLALVLATPLVFLVVRSPFTKLHPAAEAYYKTMGEQQNVLSESVNAIATVKSLGFESLRMRRWADATDAMLAALRTVMESQRDCIVTNQGVSRLLGLMVIVLAGWRLARHHITIGDLFALQMLTGRISGPIMLASNLYNRYQETNVALAQMADFLALDRERARTTPSARDVAAGDLVLRDVSLTYPGRTKPALSHLDLALPERGVIALVGRNGSGKSTLIRILLGLNRAYEGDIEIGGRDLLSFDPRRWRASVAAVDQDTVLFSGSVRENLRGPRQIEDRDIESALAFAGALDLVAALPGGLDAMLTEGGRTLSGGQRQRLAIARTIVRDPRVALLDEPTAFLDAEAAIALEKRLAVWGRERLLLLVSHNLAATREADRILVLDEGCLVGDGAHDELVRTCPRYASLWADYTRNLERR